MIIEKVLSDRIVQVNGAPAFTTEPYQNEEFFDEKVIENKKLADLLIEGKEMGISQLSELLEKYFIQLEKGEEDLQSDLPYVIKVAASSSRNRLYYLDQNPNRVSTLANDPLFEIQVSSNLLDLTNGNPNYSLEGLKYTIYKDSTGRYPIATLITDANGYASIPVSQILTVSPSNAKYGYTVKNDYRAGDYPEPVYPGGNSTYVSSKTTTTYLTPDLIENGYRLERVNNPVSSSVYTLATKRAENQTVKLIETASLIQDQLDTNAFPDLSGMWIKASFYTNYEGSGDPERVWYFTSNEKGTILFKEEFLLQQDGYKSDPFYLNDKNQSVFPLGSLRLEEIKAPSGYYLPENRNLGTISWTQEGLLLKDPVFTPKEIWQILPEKGESEELQAFPGAEMLDELIYMSLVKKDENGKVLSGVEFSWTDPDSITRTLVSGEDGVLRLKKGDEIYRQDELYGLAFGTHTFKEIKAPEEYMETLISFSVEVDENGIALKDADGEINLIEDSRKPVFEIINRKKQKNFSLEIRKTDDKDQPLSNVVFELSKKNEVIARKESDQSGILSFENLEFDESYTLSETTTPQGFKPLDPFTFRVNDQGVFINDSLSSESWISFESQLLRFHLVNEILEIEELPETGSMEVLIVFCAAALAFSIYLLLGKQKQNAHE